MFDAKPKKAGKTWGAVITDPKETPEVGSRIIITTKKGDFWQGTITEIKSSSDNVFFCLYKRDGGSNASYRGGSSKSYEPPSTETSEEWLKKQTPKTYSSYQQAIIDEFKNGECHISIRADAGCGKTFMLVELIAELVKNKK